MEHLERSAASKGVTVAYGCKVTGVQREPQGYAVEIRQSNGETDFLKSACLINAAGLHADSVAGMAGIDIDNAGYRIRPCKGEYFRVSGGTGGRFRGSSTRRPLPCISERTSCSGWMEA